MVNGIVVSVQITWKFSLATKQIPGKIRIYGLTPWSSFFTEEDWNFISTSCMDIKWHSPLVDKYSVHQNDITIC